MLRLQALWNMIPERVKYELKSGYHTFLAIFFGYLVGAPAINALIGTDLPDISQFSDLLPIVADCAYRAIWLTVLTQFGFAKYRAPKEVPPCLE